jgi:hypothetical protein
MVMIYLQRSPQAFHPSGIQFMKRFIPTLITIGLSLLLALSLAALTYSGPSDAKSTNFTNGAFFMQSTPNAPLEDKSVVGSTDQIVIMGGVIAAIIVVPILLSRKAWR